MFLNLAIRVQSQIRLDVNREFSALHAGETQTNFPALKAIHYNGRIFLNAKNLDKETLEDTISVLLKHEADLQKAKRQYINPPPPPPTRQKPDEYGRFSGN